MLIALSNTISWLIYFQADIVSKQYVGSGCPTKMYLALLWCHLNKMVPWQISEFLLFTHATRIASYFMFSILLLVMICCSATFSQKLDFPFRKSKPHSFQMIELFIQMTSFFTKWQFYIALASSMLVRMFYQPLCVVANANPAKLVQTQMSQRCNHNKSQAC